MLGVAKDADQKAIKDAFRDLAMKYHPDRNKAADAETRFKEIAEAYAVLSDTKKRADYDAKGFAGVGDVSVHAPPHAACCAAPYPLLCAGGRQAPGLFLLRA